MKKIYPKVNGLWFFGMAGSGKTFASSFLAQKIERSFVIDGDTVRNFVSGDLGYSKEDREIQINRILGIAELALENEMFPIMSSVSMTKEVLGKCAKRDLSVVRLGRPFEQLKDVRNLYDGQKNVVGVDMALPDLKTSSILNDGTSKFYNELMNYADFIST
jgi:adenylylsulfate kinase